MNPDILIITRSSTNSAVSKLKLAGANNVIMPDAIGGSHMASLVANADVMEFLDIIRVQGNKGANMESISYEELPDEFRDKTIGELESKNITGDLKKKIKKEGVNLKNITLYRLIHKKKL